MILGGKLPGKVGRREFFILLVFILCYNIPMNTVIVKYIFWILVSLPMLILGIVLFSNITGDIYSRFREDQAQKKAQKADDKRRNSFEESYRRQHSGGK